MKRLVRDASQVLRVARHPKRAHRMWERALSQDNLTDHLKDLFAQLQITLVLDVGAHKGRYGQLLRKQVQFHGEIVSFEPVPQSLEELQRVSEADEHWACYPYALGTRTGHVELFDYGGSGVYNSLLLPNEYGKRSFPTRLRHPHSHTVPMYRLDHLARQEHLIPPDSKIFLKIDAQGADLDVLAGAEALHPLIKGLQIELSAKPIYEGVTPLPEALARIGELGFELTGIYTVKRDTLLRVADVDCVFRAHSPPMSPTSDS